MKNAVANPISRDLMIFVAMLVIGACSFGYFLNRNRPSIMLVDSQNLPTPTPTLDFKTWPTAKDGVVSMRFGWSSSDGGVINPPPLPALAQVIKHYPEAKRFELNWGDGIGSAYQSDTVIYNRQAKMLRIECLGTQGGTKCFEWHSLYGQVDDVDLFKAARIPNADFDDLSGCELLSTNAKHHKKWREKAKVKPTSNRM